MSSLRTETDALYNGLLDFESKALIAMQMYCETAASDLEGYMKENRPWTDRTGQARQRLTSYVERTPTGFRIVVAHGVDYGIWLELAHEKRYAILEPTIRLKGPEVIRGFRGLVDLIGDV